MDKKVKVVSKGSIAISAALSCFLLVSCQGSPTNSEIDIQSNTGEGEFFEGEKPNDPTINQPSVLINSPVPTVNNLPSIYNFVACLNECNGQNSSITFPEGIKIIYVRWDFENIPIDSDYVRSWKLDGREWIRYQCAWPGPGTGSSTVTFQEPKGLHSGEWEVTISVNGKPLMSEKIYIEGIWDYWDPAGVVNECFGIVP